MNNRKTGTLWEKQAVSYLRQQGFEILQCNYRCPCGEIDIIAREHSGQDSAALGPAILCFVEVKYRGSARYGYAVESVTPAKQKKIRRTAAYYLAAVQQDGNLWCRFDVLGFDRDQVVFIRDAF